MPIAWQRPDGGVSLTMIPDDVLAYRRRRSVIMPDGTPRTDAAGAIDADYDAYVEAQLKAGDGVEALIMISEEETGDAVVRIAREVIQPKTPHLAGLTPALVVTAAVPTSRRFRDCWRHDGAGVSVDMAKARGQRIEEIRAERDSRLRATDGEMLREQEQGTPRLAPLAAHRQALRDLPPSAATALDAVVTPEGLDAYQPPWPVKPV